MPATRRIITLTIGHLADDEVVVDHLTFTQASAALSYALVCAILRGGLAELRMTTVDGSTYTYTKML